MNENGINICMKPSVKRPRYNHYFPLTAQISLVIAAKDHAVIPECFQEMPDEPCDQLTLSSWAVVALISRR